MEELAVCCKGTTLNGAQCARSTGLSPSGYCRQHINQDGNDQAIDPKNNNNNVTSNVGPSPVPKPQLVKPSTPQNKQQQEMADSNSEFGSRSDVSSQLSSQQEQGELPRCEATAVTTKMRCKKFVSVANERFCPAHGGAQLKARIVLPLCRAVSQRNRTPCKNHVSAPNEQFCSHHGGKSKNVRMVLVQPSDIKSDNNNNNNNNNVAVDAGNKVNWSSIQAVCLEFVIETHPQSKCHCSTTKPCKKRTIVQWAQKAAKLAQSSPESSIFGAYPNELAALMPQNNHALFSDLFLAVELFGSNMSFLPQLFYHVEQSFQEEVLASSQGGASDERGQRHG